jgi:hypothetical protein
VGLGVGRGVLGAGVTVPGVGVSGGKVTPNEGDGEKRPKDGLDDGNHGVIPGVATGVGAGVGVSCWKISNRENVGPGSPAMSLVDGVEERGPMSTASVPPAKIRPARSSTPTARIPGPRLPTRAVSRVLG